MPIAFSTMVVKKTDKMVVSVVEYHNTTGEGIMPLDGDVVHIMISLPERVYINDCSVIEYAEQDCIEIQL